MVSGRSNPNHPYTKETTMLLTHEFLSAYLRSQVKSERGAALVEYALLVALIAVVCIAAVTLLGNKAKSNFTSVTNSI